MPLQSCHSLLTLLVTAKSAPNTDLVGSTWLLRHRDYASQPRLPHSRTADRSRFLAATLTVWVESNIGFGALTQIKGLIGVMQLHLSACQFGKMPRTMPVTRQYSRFFLQDAIAVFHATAAWPRYLTDCSILYRCWSEACCWPPAQAHSSHVYVQSGRVCR